MRHIPTTQGFVLICDDEDYETLAASTWHAHRGRNGARPARYDRATKCRILVHHQILGKPGDGMVIDHINGDVLDNRRANLRICTAKENSRNKRTLSATGFKGVAKHGRKWTAGITVDGRRIYLGLYVTIEDAARAYDAGAIRYFGEFARLNFPSSSEPLHHTPDGLPQGDAAAGGGFGPFHSPGVTDA